MPATVAGESIATDIKRCQLKPLRQADYYPITFTPAQWAALRRTFPTGVCDCRPGVDQQPTVPWLSYQTGNGQVIYRRHDWLKTPPPEEKPTNGVIRRGRWLVLQVSQLARHAPGF
jgi:hypothetical protein